MKANLPSLKRIVLLILVLLPFITTTTFAQSANCAGATLLTVNAAPVTGSVTDATVNDPTAAACAGGAISRDGWYRFVATASTATVTVSSTNRQLVIYAYSGTCAGLSQISCANANTTAGAQVETMNLTGLTATSTYYIRVVNSTANNMTLDAVSVSGPPSNNTCATATSLPCGTTNLAGTTVGTTSITNNTGCFMADYGVWYTFVGDGQQTTISSTAGAGFDHEMSVSSGSCGALTSLSCQDSGLSGGTESYTFTTVAATTYYVYISHYSSGSTTTGTFTISRSCAPAPTPPANNLCANATALPCGTTNLAGTTVNAANIVHGTGCTMADYGVWYTFVGDGNPTTISTNPSFDIKLSISTGSCGALSNIVCTDSSPETATFTTVLGTAYYVYVAYWSSGGSTTGTFTISRSCVTCAPPTANAATNITLTSATVSWNPPSYTPSNGYQYAVTTSATPPGSGTATTATTQNITALTPNTVYYLHVRSDCGAVNGFSTWSTISFITGYCTSTSTSSTYHIDDFSTTGGVANITNNNSNYSATGYGNFTAQTVSQQQYGTISFSTTIVGGSSGFTIWVDWNDDLDFNDVGETVFLTGSYVTAATGSFTIPGTAAVGNHRMRIRSDYFATNPSACGSISSGETEDYTLNVIASTCPGIPTAVAVSVSSTTTATVNWTASSPAPASGYQIYLSTSATLPTGATVPTHTTAAGVTTLALTGLTANTTYYVYVRNNCGSGNVSPWTAQVSFFTGYCVFNINEYYLPYR